MVPTVDCSNDSIYENFRWARNSPSGRNTLNIWSIYYAQNRKNLSKMWYAKKSGSLISLTINWIANHSTNEENQLTPPLKLHV